VNKEDFPYITLESGVFKKGSLADLFFQACEDLDLIRLACKFMQVIKTGFISNDKTDLLFGILKKFLFRVVYLEMKWNDINSYAFNFNELYKKTYTNKMISKKTFIYSVRSTIITLSIFELNEMFQEYDVLTSIFNLVDKQEDISCVSFLNLIQLCCTLIRFLNDQFEID